MESTELDTRAIGIETPVHPQGVCIGIEVRGNTIYMAILV